MEPGSTYHHLRSWGYEADGLHQCARKQKDGVCTTVVCFTDFCVFVCALLAKNMSTRLASRLHNNSTLLQEAEIWMCRNCHNQ